VIATVGDRIGTQVGKARLSLFNLRPGNSHLSPDITGKHVSAQHWQFCLQLTNDCGQSFELERFE